MTSSWVAEESKRTSTSLGIKNKGPFEIVLDGAARHSQRPPDLPCAYAVVMQP
jgi:hypothetical protein